MWLARALGYQYMTKRLRPRIARGIEAAVRTADEAGEACAACEHALTVLSRTAEIQKAWGYKKALGTRWR